MGQKVNPIGLRIGINRTWDSRWFSDKNYADKLVADLKLREYVKDRLKLAGISKVIIERASQNTTVTVYTARPGVIIGKKGADIEKLRSDLSKEINSPVALNIVEIRKPEIDAQLVAEGIAQQLERRVSFRRAMKRATQSCMRLGAKGIRVNVAGRLGGTDIARTEWYREGRVPLHTLRADLDYGFAEALTTYGIIGVKVWIYKGDIMEHDPLARDKRLADGRVQDTGGGAPRSAKQE
jgi:small subunit ribosomal protein S3